ncbi:DUF488 domain-containing protein [archaeon]|nr:DUF488 domain-containing protein [archaeon]
MLRTKSIFAPISLEDGLRVSVMSRHTLNDGITPDKRIVPGKTYDVWRKDLAPTPKLVGDHYHGKVSWNEFTERYTNYLRRPEVTGLVSDLANESMFGRENVTLLCVEENAFECHRSILVKECLRYVSDLQIRHV